MIRTLKNSLLMAGISMLVIACQNNPGQHNNQMTEDSLSSAEQTTPTDTENRTEEDNNKLMEGTYLLKAELDGDPDSRFVVKRISKDSIQFLLYAINGGPAYNSGTASGNIAIRQNKAIYTTEEFDGWCSLQFSFGDSTVSIVQEGSDLACGFGHNVDAGGTYKWSDETLDFELEGR